MIPVTSNPYLLYTEGPVNTSSRAHKSYGHDIYQSYQIQAPLSMGFPRQEYWSWFHFLHTFILLVGLIPRLGRTSGEGNGNPLLSSCLENSIDRGTWQAAVHGELMLMLQYFGHLMQRTDSLEKTLMLGKIEGSRRSRQQRMRWLDDITDSMDKLREIVVRESGMLQSMESQKVGHN